jgi:hypothetical protein
VGVDGGLAVVHPTAATGDLITATRAAAGGVPVAAVVLNQTEAVRLLSRAAGGDPCGAADVRGSVPAYADAEAACRALARAATYGAWLSRPPGHLPEFSDLKAENARELVRSFLNRSPRGGWLPPEIASELLACYGIPLASPIRVTSAEDAVPAAASRCDTELRIGVAQEPVFGPLVTVGAAGAGRDGRADGAAALTPLTDTDADELISAALAPRGGEGAPRTEPAALREAVLRVSRLADDLAEVAELDLNAVIARPDGVSVSGARIRLAPVQPRDPFLRRLR